MPTKKVLTMRERVAVKSLVFGIIPNWYDAYKVAYDGTISDVEKLKSFQPIVSRWKNNQQIQAYYNECIYLKSQDEERKKQDILKGFQDEGKDGERLGGNVGTKRERETKTPKMVDFSNPQNQMQKLNELVNSSDDVGETLDALKVIISTQKADRESAKEGKQVKTYLPMTCTNCPLYNKVRK